MHIVCNQKVLSQKISICQKATSNKTTNDILKGILIVAKENFLKITGYNLEISIETSMDVDVIKEGSIVVNSRLFGDIIKKLPDTFIEIEVINNIMCIKYQNSKFEINCDSSNDFPIIPRLNSSKKYSISHNQLKSMIKQTSFAISTDSTKPTLTGELLEIQEKKISLVAIDGYRLSVRSCFNKTDLGYDKCIIPGKSLNEINSLLPSNDDNLVIEFDDKYALFKFMDISITTRVLDGEFVDYKKLLPKEYTTKVTVNTKEILDSLERASLLSQMQKSNLIKLSIREDKLLITSNNDKGNIYEEVNINLEGELLDIAFNSRYLIEGIKNIQSEEITIEFTTNVNPCIIKPVDNIDYTYLLLPVRISSNI